MNETIGKPMSTEPFQEKWTIVIQTAGFTARIHSITSNDAFFNYKKILSS